MIMTLLNETELTPFDLNIRHTRTQHNGTVEVLVSFAHEEPAWIPMRSVEAMCEFIEERVTNNK